MSCTQALKTKTTKINLSYFHESVDRELSHNRLKKKQTTAYLLKDVSWLSHASLFSLKIRRTECKNMCFQSRKPQHLEKWLQEPVLISRAVKPLKILKSTLVSFCTSHIKTVAKNKSIFFTKGLNHSENVLHWVRDFSGKCVFWNTFEIGTLLYTACFMLQGSRLFFFFFIFLP